MSHKNSVKVDPEHLQKAEQFADFMESEMRSLGSTGDYFCSEQRTRWRQHAIRAYLGQSPALIVEAAQAEVKTGKAKNS